MNDIRREITPNKENSFDLWVPFRTRTIEDKHRVTYGQLTWKPNLIVNGQELSVNVGAINRLLQTTGATQRIEICNLNIPQEKQVPRIATIGNGLATAVNTLVQPKMPEQSILDHDNDTNTTTIAVNFGGISDYVEQKLDGGRRNPKFNEEYSNRVNTVLVKQILDAARVGMELNNNELVGQDAAETAISVLFASTIPPIIGLLYQEIAVWPMEYMPAMLKIAQFMIQAEIVWAAWRVATYVINNIASKDKDLELSVHAQYILDKVKAGRFIDLTYPKNLIDYRLKPWTHLLTFHDRLIKPS